MSHHERDVNVCSILSGTVRSGTRDVLMEEGIGVAFAE